MLFYLKGEVVAIHNNHLILDVNNSGYEILVSHPDQYVPGEFIKVYVHTVVREDEQYLVGFSSLIEKDAFLSLINVKGIGPRIAVNALSATTPEMLYKAINSNNVAYLKRLPGIGAKAAAQIILDVKGQLIGTKGDPDRYEDVKEALKQLGFKNARIESVLADINEEDASMDEILAIALKKLRK